MISVANIVTANQKVISWSEFKDMLKKNQDKSFTRHNTAPLSGKFIPVDKCLFSSIYNPNNSKIYQVNLFVNIID